MTGVFDERALRSDPSDLAQTVNRMASSNFEADALIATLNKLVDEYETAHAGPDIDAVVGTARAVLESLISATGDYDVLGGSMRSGLSRLTNLDIQSQLLWNEASQLPPEEAAAAEVELSRRFYNIRDNEDGVYRDLTQAVYGTNRGIDVVFDQTAVSSAINRLAQNAHIHRGSPRHHYRGHG